MNACLNPGDVVLAPRPGFPLFWTYSSMIGFEIKTYNLDQEKDWEIDMASLEAATDERTKMVIIINPSNPTGTVWRREH